MADKFRRLAALALVIGLLGAAGCNTMEGVGKDIKGAGEAIEREASGE
ncbi:MAG: entericidin A/B family lipoprotein [Arhodomonas sp.]|nr:entericidin A/B family lipoprotein [Arhodomonas sp.]